MMTRRWLVMVIVVVVAVTTLSGCGRVLGPKPEEVAGRWYEALSAYDTVRMDELVHPERRATFETGLKEPQSALVALVGLQKRTYFDMRYQVVSNGGDAAQVRATGKVANRLGMIEPVQETVDLRKANNHWYVWTAGDWLK